jgi:hypothetical protein
MIQRSSALAVQMLLDDETITNTGLKQLRTWERKFIDEEEQWEIVRNMPWMCVKGRKRLFHEEERRG